MSFLATKKKIGVATIPARTVEGPPFITTVEPSVGDVAGGTVVKVGGRGFVHAASFRFGATEADFEVVSDHEIRALAPPHAFGSVSLKVQGSTGSYTLASGFTYTGAVVPALASANYVQGDPLGGGQSVVLTGTDLDAVTSCDFGGSAATITGQTPTTLTVTLPAHASGSADLTVTGPGGTSNAISFEYWAPTDDADVTLLYDAISNPYNAGTGEWVPRFCITPGDKLTVYAGGTATPALAGGPVFDGNLLNEGPLRNTGGAGTTWYDFFAPPVGVTQAGSMGGVFESTNIDTISTGAPYSNPLFIGAVHPSSGTLGVGFGKVGGTTDSFCAHIYDSGIAPGPFSLSVDGGLAPDLGTKYATIASPSAAYNTLTVPATAGALHAVVSRFVSSSATYTPFPVDVGTEYPAGIATQSLTGSLRSFFAMKASASDTFITKHYAWARQRFGVA